MLITNIKAAWKMGWEAASRLDENADVDGKAYLTVNLAGYRLHVMGSRAVQFFGGYGIIRLSPD